MATTRKPKELSAQRFKEITYNIMPSEHGWRVLTADNPGLVLAVATTLHSALDAVRELESWTGHLFTIRIHDQDGAIQSETRGFAPSLAKNLTKKRPVILVVGGSPGAVKLYRMVFQHRAEFRVFAARDVFEIARFLRAGIIDLVLLDGSPAALPCQSGSRERDIIRLIRKNSSSHYVPVLQMAERAAAGAGRETIRSHLRADEYLEKPVSFRRLIKTVQALVLLNETT